MKKVLFVPIIILGLFASSNVFAEVALGLLPADPIACTMEYAPVCGHTGYPCTTTPCDGVYKTYSNKCIMNAANATLVSSEMCKDDKQDNVPTFCKDKNFKKITKGSKGKYVRELQDFLLVRGYHNYISIADGIFGSKTAAAVKSYQNGYELKIDGVFGNSTRGYVCRDILQDNDPAIFN